MRYVVLILGALALSAPFIVTPASAKICNTQCRNTGSGQSCTTVCF